MSVIKFENGKSVNFDGNPTQDDIEEVARQMGIGATAPNAPSQGGGSFLGNLGRDIIKPAVRLASSFAPLGEALGGTSQEEIARRNTEGRDFGPLGNGIKPLGYQYSDKSMSPVEQGARAVSDTAGVGAELGSYTMAPLKSAGGFWGLIKEAAPMAATFTAGKAGQEGGDKSNGAMKIVTDAATNYIGATAGFGLMKGAGNLISAYGARALQSPAIKAAGEWTKNFADKVFTTMPEVFQKGAEGAGDLAGKATDFIVGASTKRTYNALEQEFNHNWKTASDAAIDSLMPEVNTPDLSMGKFQRSLSESMGKLFRDKNTLYDDVKADQTTIPKWPMAKGALDKVEKAPDLNNIEPGTPEYKQAVADVISGKSRGSELLTSFANEMLPEIAKPLTLKQTMGLYETAMSYIPKATNEEKTVIRDFAQGLYTDARNHLEHSNPDLLNQWDQAYQSFKKAGDVYGSNVLDRLKTVGDVDTFVDKMITKSLTRPEEEVLKKSMESGKAPVQDLFISSVLRKAKSLDPKEGAKVIRTFLDNWETDLLDPHQAKMLDDMASFMEGSFDDFVLGMKGKLGVRETPVQGQQVEKLMQDQGQIEVGKLVSDGRIDEIADKFMKLSDSPDLKKVFNAYSDEEKQVIGLSMTQKLFDDKLGIGSKNSDGTYNVDPKYADALIKTWESIQGHKGLNEIMNKEQIKGIKEAAEYAQTLKDVSNVPAIGFRKKLLHGLISAFYLARGWMPGGIQNAIEAAHGPVAQTKAYYAAIDKLINEEGLLEKNLPIKISDFVALLAKGSGQAIDKTIETTLNE